MDSVAGVGVHLDPPVRPYPQSRRPVSLTETIGSTQTPNKLRDLCKSVVNSGHTSPILGGRGKG